MSSGNSVGGQQKNLNWLLDDLVSRVAHVKSAIVLSRDGLTVGASEGLARDDAEHLSALAAGVQSLARGTGQHVGGGEVRQTIIEMEKAFLFVTNAGKGSCLAVLAGADADVGIIAYEMAVLVKRVGHHLASPPRSASGETSAE
jgi:predicted regulator of Ras-like GTPase activity (Roadblock/LC7/MglB family)